MRQLRSGSFTKLAELGSTGWPGLTRRKNRDGSPSLFSLTGAPAGDPSPDDDLATTAGTVPALRTLQIGNDTAAQPMGMYVDNFAATTP